MPPHRFNFVAQLAELVFPARCFGCNADGFWLCPSCQSFLALLAADECPYCRLPSAGGLTCRSCRRSGVLTGLVVAAPYDRAWRSVIHYYKFSFIEAAASEIFSFIASRWSSLTTCVPIDTVVTSVPLTRRRHHWRGFNQAEELARLLAARLNLPYRPLLKRSGATEEQSKLTRRQRLNNVQKQAFQVKPVENLPKSVIIVDDVYTTGATMETCARSLTAAGVETIWGCVIARGAKVEDKALLARHARRSGGRAAREL